MAQWSQISTSCKWLGSQAARTCKFLTVHPWQALGSGGRGHAALAAGKGSHIEVMTKSPPVQLWIYVPSSNHIFNIFNVRFLSNHMFQPFSTYLRIPKKNPRTCWRLGHLTHRASPRGRRPPFPALPAWPHQRRQRGTKPGAGRWREVSKITLYILPFGYLT